MNIDSEDVQTINLDINTGDTNDVNDVNDNLFGVELLVDPKKRSLSSDETQNETLNDTSSPISNKTNKLSENVDEINMFSNEPTFGIVENTQSEKNINLTQNESNNPEINVSSNEQPSSVNNESVNNDHMNNTSIDPLLEGYRPIHMMTPQEIKNEKIELIYKFKRLESQGVRTTMNYTMNSNLDDMRNEYMKLRKQREIENSIKFQRKMLMAFVTGIEFLNNKVDPFSIKLDGWSESMSDSINDYDEVFEELYEKYGGGGEMAPELRLIMMVGGSAFMFHLTNTLFKTSMPSMDDILKQNPELMSQFANAAVNTKSTDPTKSNKGMSGFGNLMGMMGGMPGMGGGMPGMGGGMPGMGGGMPGMDKEYNKSKTMDGPDNIDNIINNLDIDPDSIDIDTISIASST
ncbi:MAG: hypothetical protein CMG46_01635 [Candidatus Marinimicrobia bacterium]|nr:hypothetical protein [Candidatus Neomarinimicrobiota bacterium]|tara:strand:- start:3617 stop:4831 length:1215 start_codon:yes stop_codon:yes gene_type:complete